MSHNFQPGDVAMATVRGVPNVRIMRRHIDGLPGDWAFASTEGVTFSCTSDESEVTDVRPLVVIDAEDRGQVEQLVAGFYDTINHGYTNRVERVQAALREFANPTPPRPEEPTGLGAVVEDAEGERWVRVNQSTGTQEWRCCDFNGEFRRWPAIAAVRVLSEGVTP